MASIPTIHSREQSGLSLVGTHGPRKRQASVPALVSHFKSEASARASRRCLPPVQTARFRLDSQSHAQGSHSLGVVISQRCKFPEPIAAPVSSKVALEALAQGDKLLGWSSRASGTHKNNIALAVLNALGGAEQLPDFMEHVIDATISPDVQSSIATSLALAVRSLANSNPTSLVRVVPSHIALENQATSSPALCKSRVWVH